MIQALRKESVAIFKLIQSYMGDKKSKSSPDQVKFQQFNG